MGPMPESLDLLLALPGGLAQEVRAALERSGHGVLAETGDGGRALLLARNQTPDAALVGVDLDGGDGVSAAAEIRSQCGLPVILIASRVEQKTLDRAVAARVDGYLVTPLEPAALCASLSAAYANYALERELSTQVEGLDKALAERKLLGRAKGVLMDQRGFDEDQALEFLRDEADRLGVEPTEAARFVISAHNLPEPYLSRVGNTVIIRKRP